MSHTQLLMALYSRLWLTSKLCGADRTGPVLSPVRVQSNNGNSTLAKVGNVVTLTFTVNEALRVTPSVTLIGVAAVVSGGPLAWSALTNVTSTSAEGPVSFLISVQDYAGNPSTASTTSDASAVTVGAWFARIAIVRVAHGMCYVLQIALRRPSARCGSFRTTGTSRWRKSAIPSP